MFIVRYTTEDLLLVLDHSEWKSNFKVYQDLIHLKGVGDSFLDELLRKPSYWWVHSTLHKLLDAGKVERRDCTEEVQSRVESGNLYDWRLNRENFAQGIIQQLSDDD